jgi:hypothetical protein
LEVLYGPVSLGFLDTFRHHTELLPMSADKSVTYVPGRTNLILLSGTRQQAVLFEFCHRAASVGVAIEGPP